MSGERELSEVPIMFFMQHPKQQSVRSQGSPPCWAIIVISRGSGLRIEGSPPFGEAGVHLLILKQFLGAKICGYPTWSNRPLMTWIVPFSRRQKLLAAFLPIGDLADQPI